MPVETTPFDPADYLNTPEAVTTYLEAAFEENDPRLITDALGVVARARGLTKLAEQTGLSRQALHKALSADGNPQFSTVLKVAGALGFKLVPEPAS